MVSFPPVSPPRPYTLPSPHPYAPHAQPIPFFSILSPAQYWVSSTNHLAARYAISSIPLLHCQRARLRIPCLLFHLFLTKHIVHLQAHISISNPVTYQYVAARTPLSQNRKIHTSLVIEFFFFSKRFKITKLYQDTQRVVTRIYKNMWQVNL